MIPTREGYGPPVEADFDSFPLLTVPDRHEAARLLDRGQQLEVLAEAEVLDGLALGERDPLQVDDAPDT